MNTQEALRVLFLTDHPEEGASSRFRVYQYVPFLERQNIVCRVEPFTSKALYKLIHESGHTLEKLGRTFTCALRRVVQLVVSRRYDVVLIHREAFPFGPPVFELMFLALARRLIFDFDDAIHLGHANPGELRHPLLYRLKYRRQIYPVIARADCVIAGNRILADYALKYNSCVEIIPTVVDTDRFSYREPKEKTGEPIVVGWYGSPSTSPYLGMVEGAFRELRRRHGERVTFSIYGDTQCRLPVEGMGVHPFGLESEVADLRTFDIGIMPLPDNEWTRGKCAFKAIQYMALGIPAVCSPVGVTVDLIEDGETGFLCQNEREWVAKLSALIENGNLRRKMAARARTKIESEYSLRLWAPKLAHLLRRVASGYQGGRPS